MLLLPSSAKAKVGSDAESACVCGCVVTIRTPTASTTIVIEMTRRKGKGTKDSGSFFLTSQDTSTAASATQQVAIHSGPFKLATLTIPSNDLTLSLFLFFHFPSLFILQLPPL